MNGPIDSEPHRSIEMNGWILSTDVDGCLYISYRGVNEITRVAVLNTPVKESISRKGYRE